MPNFSNVAYVILGFLENTDDPKSGYDLKQLVDQSTRFFFAASYGQIYPELKKLSDAGLVEGVSQPTGGRARVEYSITGDGSDALRVWLLENKTRLEMRDEGLLRVFFSDHLSREERIAKLREMREDRAVSLAELEAVECAIGDSIPDMPSHALEYGLGLHRYVIDWCDRTIAQLEKETE